MTIIVRHNEAGDKATETVLEGVQEPEVWAQAFFRFKSLDGTVKFMIPVGRLASLEFKDNSIITSLK